WNRSWRSTWTGSCGRSRCCAPSRARARASSRYTDALMADAAPRSDLIERLVSLCKQRGFVFPSSEIYGGLNAVYDYGPLGVRLRRNIRDRWWESTVELRDDVEGIESAILMNPEVWVASGHVAGFTDPLVDCTGPCKKRWREDHLAAER